MRTTNDCWSSVDRVDGKTVTGKAAGVVAVVAAAEEEVEEDFGEAGMVMEVEVDSVVGMEVVAEVMEAVDVVAVDTAMEALAAVTTSREEETVETTEEEGGDIRETGTSQPPMAGPGTNFHSAIHMFTQKTADFYR